MLLTEKLEEKKQNHRRTRLEKADEQHTENMVKWEKNLKREWGRLKKKMEHANEILTMEKIRAKDREIQELEKKNKEMRRV